MGWAKGFGGFFESTIHHGFGEITSKWRRGGPKSSKTAKPNPPPRTICHYLRDVPPLKLVEFMNQQKAADIRKLLNKISSLAHFSQSMTDYFAHDDALEPALAVICEILRNNFDDDKFLGKNTTFLSLAQPYDKLRSKADHDVLVKEEPSNTTRSKRFSRSRQYCFAFQDGTCKFKYCNFRHACDKCGSTWHGGSNCSRKRKRDRPDRKSKN